MATCETTTREPRGTNFALVKDPDEREDIDVYSDAILLRAQVRLMYAEQECADEKPGIDSDLIDRMRAAVAVAGLHTPSTVRSATLLLELAASILQDRDLDEEGIMGMGPVTEMVIHATEIFYGHWMCHDPSTEAEGACA